MPDIFDAHSADDLFGADALFGHVINPPDLDAAIRQELAALADISARHEAHREQLNRWSGRPALRERRVRHLEEHHRRERESHVLRLADLHREMMARSMFRQGRTIH